jgi:hypothetical protein
MQAILRPSAFGTIDRPNEQRSTPHQGFGVFGEPARFNGAHRERVVPFESVTIAPWRCGTFSLHGENGLVVHIPLDRARTGHKNGIVVWQRPRRPE